MSSPRKSSDEDEPDGGTHDSSGNESDESKEDTDAFNLSETPEAPVEPPKKKAREEHHATAKSRELAQTTRLLDKIVRMRTKELPDADVRTATDEILCSKTSDELSAIIVNMTTACHGHKKLLKKKETLIVTEMIALESVDPLRKKYFDDMREATRSAIVNEMANQKRELKKYNYKVKKAICNVRVLQSRLVVGDALVRSNSAKEIFNRACIEKGKRSDL
jgi:hypothetical protein